ALDAEYSKLIARFKDTVLMTYCDVDLCLHMFFETRVEQLQAMHYFAEGSRLLAGGLVKTDLPREAPSNSLRFYRLNVPARVVNYLLSVGDLDPELSAYCRLNRPQVSMEHVVLPERTLREVLSLAEQFSGDLQSSASVLRSPVGELDEGGVLQFCGPSGTGKTHCARAVATALNAPILEVDCGKLAADESTFKERLEDIFWQARVAGAVLVFEQCEAMAGKKSPRLTALFSEFERWDGLAILCTNDASLLDCSLERWVVYQFEFEAPEILERERLWKIHLPTEVELAEDVHLEQLAGQYELTGNQIRNAVLVATNQALALDPMSPIITVEGLKRASHTQMRASLSQYARRSKVQLTMSALILPDAEKNEIESILDAARHRTFVMTRWGFGKKLSTGKGIVIMFCGEPGTGKTLCAEIMARMLDLELYQVAIPQVMSKYIGETEKNIAQIFQTAKANHAMLLFDEADALFTSRVKVESSVDKFANMETNLLLQEIERFEGIVILTTNLDKQIDKAFQRRIQFKVTFPFPEAEHRALIWKHLFPAECPISDEMDWDILGKSFEISGGHIKNAVLRAAYRAACTGGEVTMETVRFAAEQECKQAGKLFRSFKLEHELDDEDF
ncbi:MAG TPA: AAA family ATPase, partial [Myxococcales bacterium]|nr:AAA family ATPase [Myxococcales bacterium]